ncbi:MAG: hypothetical protein P8R54_25670 [Myxococcota bacterium]|nr:hypothetical protein [Myxococcota bacterium]
MMRWTHLALLSSLGCSAPEVAPAAPTPPDPFSGRRPPESQPENLARRPSAPDAPDAPDADRPPTEEDVAAAGITEPPPTEEELAASVNAPPMPTGPIELPPVDRADLVHLAPPYSGWTISAPLALTGPGGATLTTLDRAGVRVEVIGKRDDRINIQCSGCTGEWRDAGGWVPAEVVYPAGHPAPSDLPLAPALSLRAGWARGENLPEGADRGAMCRLIDLGYITEDEQSTWSQDGGQLVVARADENWEVTALSAPSESSWRCRVTRSDDTALPEAAPQ